MCDLANTYFAHKITPQDVVWSYSGVRPLYGNGEENASAVTRDYVLEIDQQNDEAPLLNIYGGKITTYRKLAEAALGKLSPFLGNTEAAWTSGTPLPGGDMPNASFDDCLAAMQQRFSWLPSAQLYRYVRNYGTLTNRVIAGATDISGLGQHLGDDVYENELRYLMEQEWARTADDVLWRRSKLGLHVSTETAKAIADWFDKTDHSIRTAPSGEGNDDK